MILTHETIHQHEDVWRYHSPGDKRDLPTIQSVRLYARSPSTQRVEFCGPIKLRGEGEEYRIYATQGRIASFFMPYPCTYEEFWKLATLRNELQELGKLVKL